MRIRGAVIGMAVAMGGLALGAPAQAQSASGLSLQVAQAAPTPDVTETPPPRRPRPRVRIYRAPERDERGVYPSYNPGPDAVRDCTATYVEEHRPSGTVITPRMNCFWRRG